MPTCRALPCLLAGLVLAATTGLAGAGPAGADPLVDARQRATALRTQVDELAKRTDTAVEAYDEAEADLAAAVAGRVRAEQALDAGRARGAAAQDARTARVRTLYELGGPAALYGTVLRTSSPADAVHGIHIAQRLLGLDAQTAARDAQEGAGLAAQTRAAVDAAQAQAQQTRRVDGLVTQVQALLAQQQELLAAADADVVRLAREQQERAERAAEQAFASSLAAAPHPGPEVPPSQRAAVVLAAATAQLGKPYRWGATGPDAFDCSGLTGWAYAAAGVTLPRTSRQQWSAGPHPALADLQPGDLLFWGTDPADPATIHHVAIYVGGGRMVEAPHTGSVVQVREVYAGGYVGATRIG